jgi:hypothetical protein
MFKGVSLCIPTASILYFGLFNPSITLPYPFLSHTPFFNNFQYKSLYSLLPQMLCFMILLTLSFSFPFSKFHKVVPLLQTCSTHEFVYDHGFFVYMFIIWIYLNPKSLALKSPRSHSHCCLVEPGKGL